MQYKRALMRFLIFAMMGLLLEVFFGATNNLIRMNWNLRGSSSPWMMLDYGLFGIILMPMARPLIRRGVPLPARAFLYMCIIFLVEYVSGVLFHFVLGLRIWDYTHLPYNLHGQIALYYAPAWYALGLVAEYLYRRVDACAVVLVRGLRAEQLERLPAESHSPSSTLEE